MGAGDRAEFEAFARAALPGLLRYGRLLSRDEQSAEDLVQTALARTFVAWGRVREHRSAEAYVRTTMLRELINHKRRRADREHPVAEVPDQPTPQVPDSDRETVMAALAQLPPRQRAVLVLRYYEDRTEREIADLLGISVGTVKSQASKALARLREHGGLIEVTP